MRSRSERRSSPLRRMRTGTPGWQQQPRRERYDSPEHDVFERLAPHRLGRRVAAPCIGRHRSYRGAVHRGRWRFSSQTRGGRYSRARYYHPGLARFISEDPIGFQGRDINLYVYAASNPVNLVDPLGRQGTGGIIVGAILGGFQGLLVGINTTGGINSVADVG